MCGGGWRPTEVGEVEPKGQGVVHAGVGEGWVAERGGGAEGPKGVDVGGGQGSTPSSVCNVSGSVPTTEHISS